MRIMRGSRDSRERADRPVSPIGVASLGRSLAISGWCRRAIRCRDRARVHAGGCEINVSAEAFSLGARTHLHRRNLWYLYRREPRGRASPANICTSPRLASQPFAASLSCSFSSFFYVPLTLCGRCAASENVPRRTPRRALGT